MILICPITGDINFDYFRWCLPVSTISIIIFSFETNNYFIGKSTHSFIYISKDSKISILFNIL